MLIIAEWVKELDRPVFAIPGPIISQVSKGPNILAKTGAKVTTDVSDIFQVLCVQEKKVAKKTLPKVDSAIEQQILELLQRGSLDFGEIVRHSQKRFIDNCKRIKCDGGKGNDYMSGWGKFIVVA